MKDEWCGQNLLVKFNPISTGCNPTSTEHYEGFRHRWHDQRAIASLSPASISRGCTVRSIQARYPLGRAK